MKIPDTAIDAAAKALHAKDCGFNDWQFIHTGQWPYRDRAIQALEASAPQLIAQALREASDAYPLETAHGAEHAVMWLKERATEIEAQA